LFLLHEITKPFINLDPWFFPASLYDKFMFIRMPFQAMHKTHSLFRLWHSHAQILETRSLPRLADWCLSPLYVHWVYMPQWLSVLALHVHTSSDVTTVFFPSCW
jgi:hypothetical protein